MAHTDTPHPIVEVAIVFPVDDTTITTAHKITMVEVDDVDRLGKPKKSRVPFTACSRRRAASLSYGYAKGRGATPCTDDACWGLA